MANSDITRIINSDEVQTRLRAPVKIVTRARRKKNPLKNLGAMVKLNPHAATLRRSVLLAAERRATKKAAAVKAGRAKVTPPAIAKKLAAAKAHRPQQKKNFARIARD